MKGFLPISRKDMEDLGWDRPDFVIVTGDAYVDHPSFGAAIIGRVLESYGYRIGIIAQPEFGKKSVFTEFGRPALGFLVTSGNIDSMVNNYTVAKKRRNKDSYAPAGKAGLRPDRALTVYTRRIKEIYPDTAVIIGGIEASLRRFGHYDYWSNKVRESVLVETGADLLVYGMGEACIVEIAEALKSGLPAKEITFVKGSVYRTKDKSRPFEPIFLPSFSEIISSKKKYAESFLIQYRNMDAVTGRVLVEEYDDFYIVQNPPGHPLKQAELDRIYSLPFMRTYHPVYEKDGGIPAIEEVKFSLVSNRGCFGGCNFCALTFHQGRVVQSRSHESIVQEARKLTYEPDFKGYIHDVGGPTANFRHRACKKQEKYGVCIDKQCMFPKLCNMLNVDHSDYLNLLEKLREIPNVKKVFIRSGLRYDYLMADKNDDFFKKLCKNHISGQLKVAPEHVSPKVLEMMGKPGIDSYHAFVKKYDRINSELGKKQYLVPYFMSSHPGCDLNDAILLAEYLRDNNIIPKQVQDFYPTPGTLSTCMYYTKMDPLTGKSVYVPESDHEKAMQRALMQYRNPSNYRLVHEALLKQGRKDLIGFGKKCLIRPLKNSNRKTGRRKNDKRIRN